MIIVLEKGLAAEQINQVVAKLEENGYQVHQSHGVEKVLLGAVGKNSTFGSCVGNNAWGGKGYSHSCPL